MVDIVTIGRDGIPVLPGGWQATRCCEAGKGEQGAFHYGAGGVFRVEPPPKRDTQSENYWVLDPVEGEEIRISYCPYCGFDLNRGSFDEEVSESSSATEEADSEG